MDRGLFVGSILRGQDDARKRFLGESRDMAGNPPLVAAGDALSVSLKETFWSKGLLSCKQECVGVVVKEKESFQELLP